METQNIYISGDTYHIRLPGSFEFESGEQLEGMQVTWRSWGHLNAACDNAVVVNHALTGSADVDAWWPGMMGSGRALDPSRDYIICTNLLGSCYGTTGPARVESGTGRPYGSRFPKITVRDMVHCQKRLLDYLGVRSLACVIGGSLGGMVTLEWAAMYPDFVRAFVTVASTARHSPWAIGWSEAQRQAIMADPCWQGGNYEPGRGPVAGLATARAIAMLSYRHWDGFAVRFGRERHANGQYQAQSYLQHQGRKLAQRFEASSYVALTLAMDDFDVGYERGGAAHALSGLSMPALVVSVDSDILYPLEEQAFMASHLPVAEHVVLRSQHGHDGFLIETESLNAYVHDFRARNNQINVREGSACFV